MEWVEGERDEPVSLTEQLLATGIGERDVVREGVEPPEALRFMTLKEGELEKGELTLSAVLGEVSVPAYLERGRERMEALGDEGPAASAASAVKHYVAGRDAYRRREMNEAKDRLGEALAIEPEMAGAHVLMGQIEQELGRREAARLSYERALELDVDHPVARFRLSQLAFAAREHDEVIVLLGERVEQTDRPMDAGMRYLGEYYLGQALLREGYWRGAVERLSENLRQGETFRGNSRYRRQAQLVADQHGATQLQVAETLLKMGRIRMGLAHLEEGGAARGLDDRAMNERRAYGRVLLGEDDAAEAAALAELERPEADERALGLSAFVYRNTGDPRGYARVVRALYDAEPSREVLALAVIEMMGEGERGNAFATAHLEAHPGHARVYGLWLERVGTGELGRVLDVALRQLELEPSAAEDRVEELIEMGLGREAWEEALEGLDAVVRDSAAAWYFRAMLAVDAKDGEGAREALSRSLDREPDFVPSVLGEIDLMIRAGQTREAIDRIGAYDPGLSPRLSVFHAAALEREARGLDQSGDQANARARRVEALAIVERRLERVGDEVELMSARGGLLWKLGRLEEAERMLLRVLELDSSNEPAYEALYTMYEREPKKFVRLVLRAQRDIPESLTARLGAAKLLEGRKRYEEAEKVLRMLWADRGDEPRVLRELVGLLVRADRESDAEALLLGVLDGDPRDRRALGMLREVAERLERAEVYYERYEVFLNTLEPGVNRQLMLAQLYREWGRELRRAEVLEAAIDMAEREGQQIAIYIEVAESYRLGGDLDRALGALDGAMALRPNDMELFAVKGVMLVRGDRLDEAVAMYRGALDREGFEQAVVREGLAELLFVGGQIDEAVAELERMIPLVPAAGEAEIRLRQSTYLYDRPSESEKYLRMVLELEPDHGMANNNLGYMWADAGQNLDEAEAMIRKALALEPDSAAVLDSMGWVLYKRGRFGEAVEYLRRSLLAMGGSDPILLDHLGDALWRNDDTVEAVKVWREALAFYASHEQTGVPDRDSEDAKVRAKLEAKIAAVESGDEPETAEVVEFVEVTPVEEGEAEAEVEVDVEAGGMVEGETVEEEVVEEEGAPVEAEPVGGVGGEGI